MSKVIPSVVTDWEVGRESKNGCVIFKGELGRDKIIVSVLEIFSESELLANHLVNSVMQL